MIDADPVGVSRPDNSPFDAVAAGYDIQFTQRRLGRWLREAVHRQLANMVQPGHRVLDLGCGTGEDALWLARRGAQVTAIDVSPAMLEIAARKAAAAGVVDRVSFAQLDLLEVGSWEMQVFHYDAIFANFGVLNCVPDRHTLATALAQWMQPGGRVALVVMSPFCPWEIFWHLAHVQIRPAFRRFRSGVEARLGNGATVRVWYPSPRRLRSEFAPYFRLIHAAGIGVLLPPSYLSHLVERWPRLFARLAAWERYLEKRFPWTWSADHYLVILERRTVIKKQ